MRQKKNKDGVVRALAMPALKAFIRPELGTSVLARDLAFPREGTVWVGPDGVCLGLSLGPLCLGCRPRAASVALACGFALPAVPAPGGKGKPGEALETPPVCFQVPGIRGANHPQDLRSPLNFTQERR